MSIFFIVIAGFDKINNSIQVLLMTAVILAVDCAQRSGCMQFLRHHRKADLRLLRRVALLHEPETCSLLIVYKGWVGDDFPES